MDFVQTKGKKMVDDVRQDMNDKRQALIDAALLHVPFDGMNGLAIAAGAADLGYDIALADILLPNGGAGLAAAYHRAGDARLAASLAAEPPEGRIRDRIAAAVMMRLGFSDPVLVRAGCAILALPANAALGMRLMAETADTIWAGLGDSSQDVNWWTKRAMLASAYSATVLYWLSDESEGATDTRLFLDRRIGNIMGIEKAKASLANIPGMAAAGRFATGWISAPKPRDLPGGQRRI